MSKDTSGIYIDWPSAPLWAVKAKLFFFDPDDNCEVSRVWERPAEQSMERGKLELQVRHYYRIHPSRISKMQTETLIDMLKGMGIVVKDSHQ